MADRVVIALGGGGVRGIAHLGVLKKLEEAGFHVTGVAGTSIGAIIGALYAAGFSIARLEEAVRSMDSKKLFDRSRDDAPSLMGLAGVKRVLSDMIGSHTFDDLIMPFACTAVDLKSNQEIVIKHGSIMRAVQASAAFPGIFPPIFVGDMELVDGGVMDPVPVSLARWLAPTCPVVAVCLSPVPEEWAELPALPVVPPTPLPHQITDQFSRLRVAQAFRIFAQSMDITSRTLAELRLQIDKPEILIRPDVSMVGVIDRVDPNILIQKGEEAAEAVIPDLKKCFSLNQQVTRIFRSARPPGRVFDPDTREGQTD